MDVRTPPHASRRRDRLIRQIRPHLQSHKLLAPLHHHRRPQAQYTICSVETEHKKGERACDGELRCLGGDMEEVGDGVRVGDEGS